jgi:hypothetical protein
MSATEAAKARGLTVWAAYRWADRQARRWPDQRGSEENVQARMRSASIAPSRASTFKPATPDSQAGHVVEHRASPIGSRDMQQTEIHAVKKRN